MAGKIQLKITTPSGTKFTQEVDEFTAPSVNGEFGVLPAHRPLLAGLKTGIVSYRVGNEETKLGVGPGFVKVEDDVADIITDRFTTRSQVDPVVCRKDLKEAQDALDRLTPESDQQEIRRLIAAIRWAAIRLELYGDPPPPTLILAHEMRLLSGGANYVEVEQDEPKDEGAD